MECLGQIEAIEKKIKSASVPAIKALHKFIYREEGDRNNRKRLRNFKGFPFSANSEEYTAQLEYARRLTTGDLISSYDEEEEESEEEDNEETADKVKNDSGSEHDIQTVSVRPQGKDINFAFNYKDVEDTLRTFDGSNAYPVEKWIEDFEEAAEIFRWTDLQKLVFAKRSLSGLAKLFIQSERAVNSWNKLKDALKKEFISKSNSAQIHKMLSERKLAVHESVQEYYLTMKELASRGSVEEEALIQYIVDGVTDDTPNKFILFAATTLEELKKRLETYEELRRKHREKSYFYKKPTQTNKESPAAASKSPGQPANSKTTISEIRCFICGKKGHHANDCKDKSLGRKCFKCQSHGHIASDCPSIKKENLVTSPKINNISVLPSNNMTKEIKINNITLNALIDTGSQLTIIRASSADKLNAPVLNKVDVTLSGLGKHTVSTLGYFSSVVNIDNSDFPCNIYVVPDNAIYLDVIVGRDILSQAEVKIDPNGISIQKISQNIFLAEINVQNDTNLNIEESTSVEPRQSIEKLITDYKLEKTKSTDVEMKIVLKDETPIFERPRRLPVPEREIVDKQVEEWIKEDIVEPCASDFCNQVVVVKKKDGSPRVCIDYRKINKVIVKDRYPLPLIEDQLDKLHDAKIFTTLDMKNGLRMLTVKNVEEGSRKYTSFVTHKVPYIDDFIIPAENEDIAFSRLKLVLDAAKEFGLELNLKKCAFLKLEVEFLGHVIKSGRIYPSLSKTQAVIKFPEPKTVKERLFAVETLKACLSRGPVLNIYNPKYETELHTDASSKGYGAILLQKSLDDNQLHPVYYFSKKTSEAEKKYSSYELEVLAVIEALKRLRVYLLGIKFKIVTDCQAFEKTMSKRDIATKIARWALLLQEYDYTIEHKPGVRMKHVDALSRHPIMFTEVCGIAIHIKRAQDKDESIKVIKDLLKEKPYEDYFVKNDILYKFSEGLNKKAGKQEGYLHPLFKGEVPLQTYHLDHLGPLQSTSKKYSYILAVIDSFTKFVWLYSTKSTTSAEVIVKLEIQKTTFGSPAHIITDKCTAFTSKEFTDYCDTENIKLSTITTGLPRANGQRQRKLRQEAKKQILKVQNENKKTYNLRRKSANAYKIGDLVAIKRTQVQPGSKLKPKYLGPYRIIKVKDSNTYDVTKEGYCDGPKTTTTCAEYVKPWVLNSLSSGADEG
ncbi:uncharacterized protein LOC123987838 [Osmia bicornis bicornis]|uniref:uncharacterized protein LOC123987838 n=1 Tax=Osmia bicornis bicornis TaxID=1437191 RepID=UPI001EAF16B6|nr:uncharacterized protein LOC123987838 [Osmia bicornis bicornis]